MIPSQTLENYPIFADGAGATKVEPTAAERAAGFQPANVLPAQWANWAWNKNSKGITDLNTGLSSVEAEMNNVLSEAHLTPSAGDNTQLYQAFMKNSGCIMASSTTITNAPSLANGTVIRVMFTEDITGSDTTTGLLISYNGSNKAIKICKNGALEEMKACEITSGVIKYVQAYTTLELVYDGTNFIVIGNPVVLSGENYTVFADGSNKFRKTYRNISSNAGGQVQLDLQSDKCYILSVNIKEFENLFISWNIASYYKTYFIDTSQGSYTFREVEVWYTNY